MKKLFIFILACTTNTQYIQTQNQLVHFCTKVFSDLSKNTDFLYNFFSDQALEVRFIPSGKDLILDCRLFLESFAATFSYPTKQIIKTEFFKKVAIPSSLVASSGAILFVAGIRLHTKKSSTKKILKPLMIFGGLGIIATAGIHTLSNGIKADRLLRFVG